MTHDSRLIPLRRPGILLFLCWTLLGLGGTSAGSVRTEPFQATVPVADRSEAAQSAAFQAALRIVLVRLTGRRGAGEDPTFAPLVSEARRYVQQYHPAADNLLTVAFDGAALERWLSSNGQPTWGRDRPLTLVLLAVPPGTLVSKDDSSELKTAIDTQASLRGIPLLWPTAADLQANHIDPAALNGATAGWAEVARHLGADAVLIGRASGVTAASPVRWSQIFDDHSSDVSGPTEGVDRAADVYAELFAASGSFAPVDIEVDGIGDVKEYAHVQSYLESLAFVAHVEVEGLSADSVRFRLSARGGILALQRALALNGLLESTSTDSGLAHFQLRR
jgi:hypothetical protein